MVFDLNILIIILHDFDVWLYWLGFVTWNDRLAHILIFSTTYNNWDFLIWKSLFYIYIFFSIIYFAKYKQIIYNGDGAPPCTFSYDINNYRLYILYKLTWHYNMNVMTKSYMHLKIKNESVYIYIYIYSDKKYILKETIYLNYANILFFFNTVLSCLSKLCVHNQAPHMILEDSF